MTKISADHQRRFNRHLILEHLLGSRLFNALFASGKKRLQESILEGLRGYPPGTLQPLERRTGLTAEEFRRDYFEKSRAVVLAGAARDWRCCRNWSLDRLAVEHGDQHVLLVDAEGLSGRGTRRGYEYLSLRELADNIRSGGDKYLRFSPLLQQLPVMERDIDLEWLKSLRGPRSFGNTCYMFIGGKGTRTLLHNDQPCNLYVQVSGRKKWTLYPAECAPFLDPRVSTTGYFDSPVDIDKPDLERHPLFRYIDGYEVTLEPGDVLYIPPHWWHHVENVTDTIAVACRFSSLKAALRASPTFTFLRATSMNPPIWKTMRLGRKDTNLIWAHANGNLDEVLEEHERRSFRK